MAEKTSQQYKPGRDSSQDLLALLPPPVVALLNAIMGSKEFQAAGFSGQFPTGFTGLFSVAQTLLNFVSREELEAMMGPLSDAQKQFGEALARQFNIKIMGMGPTEAAAFASKRFSAGRFAAWMLMRANGTDAMLTEMERSVDILRRKGLSGAQAKAHNQRVTAMTLGIYNQLLSPENFGKYGNLTPLELAKVLPAAVRRGDFNEILHNKANWGANNQLQPKALQNLQSKISTLGQTVSYALSSGIASNPETALREMDEVFGVNAIATYGEEATQEILRNIASLRESGGWAPEDLNQLIKSAGPGGLPRVLDFLVLQTSDQFTSNQGINNEAYNKSMMNAIAYEEPAVELFSGLGAMLTTLMPERADEIMDRIMSDEKSWYDSSYLGDLVQELTYMDIKKADVRAAAQTDAAKKWRLKGQHVPYMFQDYRRRFMHNQQQALMELGLSLNRSLGGGFVAHGDMEDTGFWSRNNMVANKVGTPRTLEDYRTIAKIDKAYDQAAKKMGLPNWQTAEKLLGIGASAVPSYRYNQPKYSPPNTLKENLDDIERRSRLSGLEDDIHQRQGRDVSGWHGVEQAFFDPNKPRARDVMWGFRSNDTETAKQLAEEL